MLKLFFWCCVFFTDGFKVKPYFVLSPEPKYGFPYFFLGPGPRYGPHFLLARAIAVHCMLDWACRMGCWLYPTFLWFRNEIKVCITFAWSFSFGCRMAYTLICVKGPIHIGFTLSNMQVLHSSSAPLLLLLLCKFRSVIALFSNIMHKCVWGPTNLGRSQQWLMFQALMKTNIAWHVVTLTCGDIL